MRKYGKRDRNQPEIVKVLRRIPGVSVMDIASVGNGAPDLVAGYRGENWLFEVKSESGRKRKNGGLTPAEHAFAVNWQGQWSCASNVEEILRKIMRK